MYEFGKEVGSAKARSRLGCSHSASGAGACWWPSKTEFTWLASLRTLPGCGARLQEREETACKHIFHIITSVYSHLDFSFKKTVVKTI